MNSHCPIACWCVGHSFTLPTVPPKNVTRITRIGVTVLGVTFVTVNRSIDIRALHLFLLMVIPII